MRHPLVLTTLVATVVLGGVAAARSPDPSAAPMASPSETAPSASPSPGPLDAISRLQPRLVLDTSTLRPTALVTMGRHAYFIDLLSSAVWRVDLRTGKGGPIAAPGDGRDGGIGIPRSLTVGGTDLVILDDAARLWRWHGTDSPVTRLHRPWIAGVGDDALALAAYVIDRDHNLYNVYRADPSLNQILRYTPALDHPGFSDVSYYLAADNEDVPSVRDLVVDQSLYVLTGDELIRFYAGRRQDYTLATPPDDQDLHPGHDYRFVAEHHDRFYLYDARWNRVLVFDRVTGAYLAQWQTVADAPSLAELDGIDVIEPVDSGKGGPPTLVWISSSGLYRSRVAEARRGGDSYLAQIAKDNGWTKEQATAYQRTQVALDRVLEAIVAQAPEVLVGSSFATDPLDPPTIYLKGPAPAFVTALVAGAAMPITIVDGLTWNSDELEERSSRAAQAIHALGFRSVSVGTEMTGEIPVTLSRVSGISGEEVAAIVASLPEDLRDSVVITVVDPPIDAFLCDPAVSASPSPSTAPVSSAAPASPSPSVGADPCLDLPEGWGPLAVVDDAAMGGLDAGVGPGRLFIGPRCVSLRGGRGGGVTLVWRAGDTRWDPATNEILYVDRDLGLIRLKSGDRVSLGGFSPGTVDATDEGGPGLAPWLATPNETCPKELWEVNQVVPLAR